MGPACTISSCINAGRGITCGRLVVRGLLTYSHRYSCLYPTCFPRSFRRSSALSPTPYSFNVLSSSTNARGLAGRPGLAVLADAGADNVSRWRLATSYHTSASPVATTSQQPPRGTCCQGLRDPAREDLWVNRTATYVWKFSLNSSFDVFYGRFRLVPREGQGLLGLALEADDQGDHILESPQDV